MMLPELGLILGWIGVAMLAVAGAIFAAAPIVTVARMAGMIMRGEPDASFAPAAKQGGNILGAAFLPFVFGLVLYLIGHWLGAP